MLLQHGPCSARRHYFLLPDPVYERKVARFLAKNELTRPKQLKVAEHPKEWLGAFEFTDPELDAIKDLRDVPAHLLQYVKAAGVLSCFRLAAAPGWASRNGRQSFH